MYIPLTACKRYCLAAGATQGNIAYAQNVRGNLKNNVMIKTDNRMTIKEIKEQLKVTNHPVAKALHHGNDFKVLIIGFNQGMILKDHKAHITSKLTVL